MDGDKTFKTDQFVGNAGKKPKACAIQQPGYSAPLKGVIFGA
jgi:hypothetical protein